MPVSFVPLRVTLEFLVGDATELTVGADGGAVSYTIVVETPLL